MMAQERKLPVPPSMVVEILVGGEIQTRRRRGRLGESEVTDDHGCCEEVLAEVSFELCQIFIELPVTSLCRRNNQPLYS